MKIKDFMLLTDIAIAPFIIEATKGSLGEINAEDELANTIINRGLYHITSKKYRRYGTLN